MAQTRDSKLVALSGKAYDRLLVIYPKSHRREYGSAMAQTFSLTSAAMRGRRDAPQDWRRFGCAF